MTRDLFRRWRIVLTGVALVFAVAPHGAVAGWHGPVCRQASVIDVMTRAVKAADYYARVDPDLVVEQPTPYPDIVRCEVSIQARFYDMPHYGEVAVQQLSRRGFEVRIVPAGFVVRDLP